jgi:hypothetical protein
MLHLAEHAFLTGSQPIFASTEWANPLVVKNMVVGCIPFLQCPLLEPKMLQSLRSRSSFPAFRDEITTIGMPRLARAGRKGATNDK